MLNKKIREKIGLQKYLKPLYNFIDTPDHCIKISIDVGLSDSAPHSGIWLANDLERCVIGIEPLKYHWEGLKGNRHVDDSVWPIIRLNRGSVVFNNQEISTITNVPDEADRFIGLSCAIDDVPKPEKRKFYHMHNPGSSSLLKPTEKHPSTIKKIETVQCVSLQDILDYIDWEKFKVIEHLKVDCEGHDLQVIKSIGKYLEKIIFITCELSLDNVEHWSGQQEIMETLHYLRHHGFGCLSHNGGDAIFVNDRYGKKSTGFGWVKSFGLPHGLIVALPEKPYFYCCDIIGETSTPLTVEER